MQFPHNKVFFIPQVTFDEERAPMFDLAKMLKEQEIKRRIEEANRKALALAEKEEREEEERRRKMQMEEEEERKKSEEASEEEVIY